MFSDAKKIISVKNRGCPKTKGVRKTCFRTLKNNYFGNNRGCTKTKGVRTHRVITVITVKSIGFHRNKKHKQTNKLKHFTLYCEIIQIHGHNISSFEEDVLVRGH